KFVQMTGFTLKEVIHKNPRILQSGFTSRKLYDDLWEAISQGRIWQGEFQNKKKDGSYYWHLMILSPLRDKKGNIVNYLAVQQDVTNRKVLEEELRKYREQLEELVEKRTNELRVSEEKFRTLAESSEDTIMRFDRNFRHLYVNPVVEKQTELPAKDFIGKTHMELGFPEILVELWEKTIASVFLKKEKNRIEFQLPNNTWIDWILLPVFNEKNEVDSVITSGRDITSLKEYEKRIEDAFIKEKELSELKSKFISTASHEFRTPLAAILSSAQLIKRYSKKWGEDEINEHHSVINESVKNITALMDDVLLISKSEEGKIKLQPEEVDIEDLLNGLVANVKPLLKTRQKINYKNNCGKKLIIIDKKIVSQIISNLLSNAIKYSGEGSQVKLLSAFQENKLIVSIIDYGIGIAKEDLPFIFDPFFRTQNAIHLEGTGLGLNIVKRMIDVLNGTINVNSEINKGTSFEVVIPLIK
ncbi:MAG: PAS domain S-box protein, partial [Ignavibacteria bacterium]|nr:PAS domain S-box protein [Ignavibacteria bacterium]